MVVLYVLTRKDAQYILSKKEEVEKQYFYQDLIFFKEKSKVTPYVCVFVEKFWNDLFQNVNTSYL